MYKIKVALGEKSYYVHIGAHILQKLGELLKECTSSSAEKCAIITDPCVRTLYGTPVEESLLDAGFEVFFIELHEGERTKSLETANEVYNKLIAHRFSRGEPIVALGGGVVGDLGGFVAATYLRGVPFAQVPTTVLAQVDSSLGGKVSVNHPLGKNLIGTFYQPRFVLSDITTVSTLPPEEFTAGFAEVIKHGMIYDKSFFELLENSIPPPELIKNDLRGYERIVYESCRIKAAIVEQDEKELSLRTILNYGHTLGHALETATNYNLYSHGEAVAIGMHAAAKISYSLGLLSEDEMCRQERLLNRFGLPTAFKHSSVGWSNRHPDAGELLEIMKLDKKSRGGRIRFVLPKRIGEVFVTDKVPLSTIEKVLEGLKQ